MCKSYLESIRVFPRVSVLYFQLGNPFVAQLRQEGLQIKSIVVSLNVQNVESRSKASTMGLATCVLSAVYGLGCYINGRIKK